MGIGKNKDIYGNYQVFDPDGGFLFTTNQKRYNWYLTKQIATPIDDNKIKLNFKPKGSGNAQEPFLLQSFENKCVCCAAKKDLTKHHVVPTCYKKYFPDEFKKHNMHDVLVLCVDCHEKYERQAEEYKDYINQQFTHHQAISVDKKEIIIKKISRILLDDYKDNFLPAERRTYLKNQVALHLNKKTVSQKDIKQLIEVIIKKEEAQKPVWQLVVENQKDLFEFIKLWRKHFLQIMQPQYMPSLWDIEYQRTIKPK